MSYAMLFHFTSANGPISLDFFQLDNMIHMTFFHFATGETALQMANNLGHRRCADILQHETECVPRYDGMQRMVCLASLLKGAWWPISAETRAGHTALTHHKHSAACIILYRSMATRSIRPHGNGNSPNNSPKIQTAGRRVHVTRARSLVEL